MIRLLSSLIVAAITFPFFAYFVFLVRDDSLLNPRPFDYKPQIGLLAFLFMFVLGLPWAPLLKRRGITDPLSIVLLAGAMGALPLAVYALFVLAGAWQSTGRFPTDTITTGWPQFIPFVASTFAHGAFCGAVIWVAGVRRNKWFQNRGDA